MIGFKIDEANVSYFNLLTSDVCYILIIDQIGFPTSKINCVVANYVESYFIINVGGQEIKFTFEPSITDKERTNIIRSFISINFYWSIEREKTKL